MTGRRSSIFTLPVLLSFYAVGCILAPRSTLAENKCLAEFRSNRYYQAIQECRARYEVSTPRQIDELNLFLGAQGRCSTHPGLSASFSLNAIICADPVAYLCQHANPNRNIFLDSHCRVFANSHTRDLLFHTPESAESSCRLQAEVYGLTYERVMAGQANQNPSPQSSPQMGSAHLDSEWLELLFDTHFTQGRIRIANTYFERVKNRLLTLLNDPTQTMIGASQRRLLVDRIRNTRLATRFTDFQNNRPCLEGIQITPFTVASRERAGESVIYLCTPIMTNIDVISPFELLNSLAHELAHVIAPCTLEKALYYSSLPAPPQTINLATRLRAGHPRIYRETYPGLIRCLRGGSGPLGCTNALVPCEDQQAVALLDHPPSGVDPVLLDEARVVTQRMPSCLPGNQIEEAFADYIGAEITGSLIREDRPSELDQQAYLLQYASSLTRIDANGRCVLENDTDTHPNGWIRTNRLLLGSPNARAALGCTAEPLAPSLNHIRAQCPSFRFP